MNVFDIIENISSHNEVMFSKEQIEQYYNQYLVVGFFSKFEDTVFLSNEANTFLKPMEKWEHYLFMHSLVRKRYRKVKNKKKDTQNEEKLSLVMEYYEVSKERAKDFLPLLTDINIEEIKTSLYGERGGIIK
jgi:hypothetical protein